jgi:predicted small metal-binding protein
VILITVTHKEVIMATKQYKKLGCMDVNPAGGCAFEVRAETEEEVLRLTADHGKVAHNMASIPPEIAAKIKSAIKTVPVTV